MARLRDVKVGMTVWIKKGRTSVNDFGTDFKKEILETLGDKYVVDSVDVHDPFCTVSAGKWWYPVDWISLTPPKGSTKPPASKASGAGDIQVPKKAPKPPKTLYVAQHGGNTSKVGTLEEILRQLKEDWEYSDKEVSEVEFYELKEVNVVYTPAKLEVK